MSRFAGFVSGVFQAGVLHGVFLYIRSTRGCCDEKKGFSSAIIIGVCGAMGSASLAKTPLDLGASKYPVADFVEEDVLDIDKWLSQFDDDTDGPRHQAIDRSVSSWPLEVQNRLYAELASEAEGRVEIAHTSYIIGLWEVPHRLSVVFGGARRQDRDREWFKQVVPLVRSQLNRKELFDGIDIATLLRESQMCACIPDIDNPDEVSYEQILHLNRDVLEATFPAVIRCHRNQQWWPIVLCCGCVSAICATVAVRWAF